MIGLAALRIGRTREMISLHYLRKKDVKMKRKLLLTAACLMLVLLSACQAKSATDTCWDAAKKAGGLEDYVKEQAESIDTEALKQEAQEGELSQQFKAAAILSTLEYQQASAGDSSLTRFRFDYPTSGTYAVQFLSKVNADPDAFWASMEDAFSPYDCYLPIFAAAQELDAATLGKLLETIPSDMAKFQDAIDEWVEHNPGRLPEIGSTLLEQGYFDDYELSDFRSTFCALDPNSFLVQTDTPEDAFQYVTYLRDTMLPAVAGDSQQSLMKTSDITGADYYSDSMMVTITGDGPSLQEPAEDGLPETIELEGKTVAAFYRNPTAGNFQDYLPSLQFMGGFLLSLPAEEVPASLSAADYYLVLTANFEKGDFYQTMGGSDTSNQQVNSITSVDLYEASTGAFLRHLGNVKETPPDTIYTSYGDTSLQYPVPVAADVLAYLYHNVNNPDAYISLVDNTPVNGTVLDPDVPVILSNWEITYHSSKVMNQFESSLYIYTASDGKQFVVADMTVTNRGLESDTFLPMLYYVGQDPIVQVADSTKTDLYDCVDPITYSPSLNNTTLDPGESKDGELIFEIPDSLAQSGEQLYLAVSLGENLMVYYPLS